MTLNAMLMCLGIALTFSSVVFLMPAMRRLRGQLPKSAELRGDDLQDGLVVVVRRRANVYCAAILLAIAIVAVVISILRGGPAVGEPSGNVSGTVLAISLATFVCLLGCLVARHFILGRVNTNDHVCEIRRGWKSPKRSTA